ncbi:MAG: methyl-accepting chemotaxis protein [Ktedonobacteraceae bacterium]
MLKWLTNTPIARRLFYAFGAATFIPAAIIFLLGLVYLNTLTTRGHDMQTSYQAIQTATAQSTNLQLINADLTSYFSTIYAARGSAGDMSNTAVSLSNGITNLQANFGQGLQQYKQNFTIAASPQMVGIHNILLGEDSSDAIATQQQQLLAAIEPEWTGYLQAQNQTVLDLKANLPYSKTHRDLLNAQNLYQPLAASWQKIVSLTKQIGKDVATVSGGQTSQIILVTVIAILFSVLVVATVGYIINLTISRPLVQLAALTRRVSKGETSARAPTQGYDEINIVASSMNKMLDNIVRLAQEAQGQRDALQGQVEKLVSEVSGVGEGDLRVQAEVTADALGVLADSFNYMVEELSSLIVRVKMVAQEVDDLTSAVVDRLTQLVDTGDIQLNQIENAAVEVEHMADSSRSVAERAQGLFNVAHQTRRTAQGGRASVQQAIEGMNRINTNVQTTSGKVQTLGERSREINNIVEVISNIAHQTNRLALDAAIQSAMAGENGKGFGAVAADIRRLAERSKEQASSIARIVRSVRDEIGAVALSMQDTERETAIGTKLTEEAGGALESIFSDVEQQAIEIENINRVAKRQLESSSAVVQIMQGISQSTQQSSLSTRDTAQTMARLARLVEQLRSSVEAFRLREDQDYSGSFSTFSMTPEERYPDHLSVSGVFRTVTATALPLSTPTALPPGRSADPHQADPFSLYPATPNQSENGGRPEQPANNRTASW